MLISLEAQSGDLSQETERFLPNMMNQISGLKSDAESNKTPDVVNSQLITIREEARI